MTDRQLIFMTACDIGDSIIAVDELGNGIFRIDKEDMSAHLLGEIESRGMQRHIYRTVERCGDEIFFFPAYQAMDEPILVYHLDRQCSEYVNLREMDQNIYGIYLAIARTENCLWLFPKTFDRQLIRFHLDSRQTEAVPQWNKLAGSIETKDTDTYEKISNVIEVQGVLYHAIKDTNSMIAIQKEDRYVKAYEVPTDQKFFIRMDYDGERFWIAESDNRGVVSWNPATRETQYYPLVLSDENAPQRDKWGKWISYVLCGKKCLWIVPQREGRLLKMDYAAGTCEWVEIFPQEFRIREGNRRIIGMVIKNGQTADLYPYFSNLVIHLDLENDVLLERHEKISLPVDWSEEELVSYQVRCELETDRIPLDEYLHAMVQYKKENAGKSGVSNGENIWKYIKSLGSE